MANVASAELDAAQNAILVAGTTYYINLCTGNPGTTGANESSLTRQAITFAASSGGSQASNSAQTYSSVPGGATYSYFGIWTTASGGTFLRGGSLTSSITPAAGANVVISSGGITFTAS